MPRVWIPAKKKKSINSTVGRCWHDEIKIKAVTTWLSLGNLTKTSEILNISLNTLQKWKQTDWWADLVKSIREADYQETDSSLSKTIKKSLTELDRRLSEGDYILNSKTGALIKVPVKAKDLNRILQDSIKSRKEIQELTDDRNSEVKDDSINNRLLKLAEQFASFAMGRAGEKILQGKVYEHTDRGDEITIKEKEISVQTAETLARQSERSGDLGGSISSSGEVQGN